MNLQGLVAGLALVVLTACGGGGSGGVAPSPGGGSGSATTTYALGGTVSGLAAGSSITILNNGGSSVSVSANGPFTFTTPLASGSAYSVTIGTQPAGQTCSVSNATGTNISASVSNVTVNCVDIKAPQTVGGTVTGLNGALTLLNNRGNPLSVSTNGSFTFSSGLEPLSTYEVTVGSQPAGQSCAILNASGTMISIPYTPSPASALNVSNIGVSCFNTPIFTGTIMLGAPTDTSIQVKLFTTDQDGSISLSYGTTPGGPYVTTAASPILAGTPKTLALTGLSSDTRYYYKANLQPQSGSSSQTPEYSFHTARPSNRSYSFAIQADSHLDENSDAALYQQTLQNISSDAPDFLVDLGDTFMTEKHNQALDPTPVSGSTTQTGSPPASTEQQVIARYRMELKYFDIATRSVPLFLANGNHDAELGWIWSGANAGKGLDSNLASWAEKSRQTYFVNPDAGTQAFYKGQPAGKENVGTTPSIPARSAAAWYAWHWGDALFIVLDPYWNSPANSGWNLSLGLEQYTWLANTLSASTARFKFVLVHNLVGGYGSMRGGLEAARLFEWGGLDATLNNCNPTCSFTAGSNQFASKRPGWSMPIHDLLVANKVTAVFHGHDHFYGHQTLDGIVYQEVPQPSAKNTTNGAALAAAYGYTAGTFDSSSGHLRVTVSATGVRSEYVRAWLPAGTTGSTNVANGTSRINKQVSQSWTCTYQTSGPDSGWCR